MRGFARLGVALVVSGCAGGEAPPPVPVATALSALDARHSLASYSPDGSRLSWWSPADSSSAFQLWVANADLSEARALPVTTFLQGQSARWSPDGTRLAAVSSQFGAADVVVIGLDDREPTRVTQGPGLELPIDWFPDGDRLAYIASAEGGTIASFAVTVSTGVSAPLVPGETRPHISSPSPDGRRLAVNILEADRSTLWVADADGGNLRQLTTEGFELFTGQQTPWSPDSRQLVYESRRTGTSDLWIVAVDSGAPRQLTREVRNDRNPVWSSDGQWIAYISDRGRQTDVWVVPSAGGVEQRVTDDRVEEESPFWRPGGLEVGFVARTEASGTWAMDLGSGEERRLTPDSLRTAWFGLSPDGGSILYLMPRGGGVTEMAVGPVAGGEIRTLVADVGTTFAAFWSPDGSRIAFSSDRAGSADIWVVQVADGTLTHLVNWPGYEDVPVWSADGQSVLFSSDRDSRLTDLWSAPVTGGEPTRWTNTGTVYGARSNLVTDDAVVQYVASEAGQFGIGVARPGGEFRVLWDRSTALLGAVSPSGTEFLALVQQPDGSMANMILPTDGGPGRIILTPAEAATWWSPDGRSVLYSMTEGGSTDIGLLNLTDSSTRRLTQTPESESGPELTPDGRTVVFRRTQVVQRIHTADLTPLMAGGR